MFIYNFNGTIYETTNPFDETYRKLKAECVAEGTPFSRQEVKGDKIINQSYHNGIWLDD